ncbi:hypothetical protein Adt_10467 [Abeliophyllum distichum]|uniref:Uncharacterized protein n=1 Tax=Abeliophyllum distichum TaxID=126358 RepID=A0ABD1UL11_9LAMI
MVLILGSKINGQDALDPPILTLAISSFLTLPFATHFSELQSFPVYFTSYIFFLFLLFASQSIANPHQPIFEPFTLVIIYVHLQRKIDPQRMDSGSEDSQNMFGDVPTDTEIMGDVILSPEHGEEFLRHPMVANYPVASIE